MQQYLMVPEDWNVKRRIERAPHGKLHNRINIKDIECNSAQAMMECCV